MSVYKDKDKDTNSKQSGEKAGAPVNLGRHESQCTVCRHVDRQAIEEKWIDWGCTAAIAKEYGVSRDSIYRHARATGLFAKRQANIKMICEKVLERRDLTLFTGSNYVSMLNVYIKIILAEEKAKAERPSDAENVQPDTPQQLDAPIPDGSLADVVEESESAISNEPQGDRDLVKLINNPQKAAEAAQSADPKPAARETTAKESDNGVLAGYIGEVFDELYGAEPGQGQNG